MDNDWLTLEETSRLVQVACEAIAALVFVRGFPRPTIDALGRPRWWRPELLDWSIDDAMQALRLEVESRRGLLH